MADDRLGGLTCADARDFAAGFVLGALEPEESAAMRRHLADCPEAHEEVVQLGSVLPALFEAVEVAEPPAGLRARILETARREAASLARPASAGSLSTAPATAPVKPPSPVAPPIDAPPAVVRPAEVSSPAPRRRWFGGSSPRPAWAAVGLAAVLAVVAVGSWSLQLRSEVDALSAYRDGVLEVLDLASAPGGQVAVLAAPDQATEASGLAGVGADGRVAVVMRDLAPTSGSQVYEVWLLGADGAPVPIGGFAVGGGGTATFTTRASGTAEGVVVALTLEPGPDATTPTMPLIALGTAKPAS